MPVELRYCVNPPQDLQGERHCAAPRLSAEASRIITAGSWTSRSRVQATSRRARRRGQGRSGEGDRLVEDAGEPFRTAGAGRSVFHSIGQSVGSSPLVAEAKFPADPGEVVAAYCLGRIEDRPVGVTLAGFGGGWVRLPHRRRPGRLPRRVRRDRVGRCRSVAGTFLGSDNSREHLTFTMLQIPSPSPRCCPQAAGRRKTTR